MSWRGRLVVGDDCSSFVIETLHTLPHSLLHLFGLNTLTLSGLPSK